MADYLLDPDVCCIKGCHSPSLSLGLCSRHWRRNRLYGSPVARRRHSGMFRGMSAKDRFFLQVKKTAGCWKWRSSKDRNGYGIFKGECNGVTYNKAHRWSYAFHYGEDPVGHHVLHSCDTPECANPNHLFLGTNADNMADKARKGRGGWASGEKAGHAVLTEDQAIAVLDDPRPYTEIASEYGVRASTVSSIKNRASWRYLGQLPVKGRHRGAHRKGVSDRLTPDIVREIRQSRDSGKELAKRFGVSPQTVTDIRKRRSWAHVE